VAIWSLLHRGEDSPWESRRASPSRQHTSASLCLDGPTEKNMDVSSPAQKAHAHEIHEQAELSSRSTQAVFSATYLFLWPLGSASMWRSLVVVDFIASRSSIGRSLVIHRVNRLSCALRPSGLSSRPSAATKGRWPYAKSSRRAW
jgi:DNA-binding PucR family transcriptional regulator